MTAPYKSLSLRWLFLYLTVVPTLLVAVIIGILISQTLSSKLEEQLVNNSKALGEHIANSSEYSLQTNNVHELTKLMCASLYASKDINEIEILNDRSVQLTSCPRLNKYDGDSFITLVPIHSIRTTNATVLASKSDADKPGDTNIGYVRITTSLSLMQRDRLHILATILTIFVGAIIFSLLFSFFLTRHLTLALVELSTASKKIASKNFQFQFSKILGGEFGQMQTSFLEMVRTMENFTKQLENNVSSRTKELEAQKNLLAKALGENKRLIAKSNMAVENERKAIALDLHDVYNTLILSILGTARRTRSRLRKIDKDDQLAQPISDMVVIEGSANRLYSLSRDLVSNLRPEGLDNLGLAEAIKDLVSQQQMTHSDCQYNFFISGVVPKLGYEFNIGVYRIAQESLSNVTKHASATRCEISLTVLKNEDRERILLRIEDNGTGFDANDTKTGIGLIGMRERAWGAGGSIDISSKQGAGTKVLFSVDLVN